MQKALVERLNVQRSTQGGGLLIESRPDNHDNHGITKTKKRMGVVFIGLENGGGSIILATTKPHETMLMLKEIIC
jgi:hypothetical protein